MFESSQALSGCRRVLIVTGCAFQDSFLKPMSLVQLKLNSDIFMA
jgi:hypothetical protein